MQEINQHLSNTLKRIRKEFGWSLDKTAHETGVSKAMLGQIERGESSPTVAVLWKIATGFNTSLSLFLESPSPDEDRLLIRDPEYTKMMSTSHDIRVATLFPYSNRSGFEVMELTLASGYARISEPHEVGVTEHVIVISGSLEVLFDGQWSKLAKGQAAKFAADREHGYRNPGSRSAKFLNIICYQR